MKKRILLFAPLGLAGIALFVYIGGEVVLQLWNWLLPPLFGFPALTFWQALGLLALCRILFGGSGWGRSGRSGFRSRMEERCRMTPEERERFRQRVRARWGFGQSVEESREP